MCYSSRRAFSFAFTEIIEIVSYNAYNSFSNKTVGFILEVLWF